MNIGLSSFAHRWFVNSLLPAAGPREIASALFGKAAELGVAALQLNENARVPEWTAEFAAEIGEEARRRGIAVELGMRSESAAEVLRHRALAEAAGSRRVRLVVDPETPDFGVDELGALLAECAPEFARTGMELALENHFRFSPDEIVRAFSWLPDGAPVSVCLDPLNAIARLAGPAEASRLLLPRASCVHVKDASVARLKTGFYVSGCPVGAGMAGAGDFLAEATKAPAVDCAFLELWMDELGDEEATIAQESAWIAQSIDYMRRSIA